MQAVAYQPSKPVGGESVEATSPYSKTGSSHSSRGANFDDPELSYSFNLNHSAADGRIRQLQGKSLINYSQVFLQWPDPTWK